MTTAVFKVEEPGVLVGPYLKLWRSHKKGFTSFGNFDLFAKRLMLGDFLLLRNRFKVRTLAVFRGGEPVLMGTLFLPDRRTDWSPDFPASIGLLCAAEDLRSEESALFWSSVHDRFSPEKIVTSLNGHHYLGFGLPSPDADGSRVAFMTSPPHLRQDAIFGHFTGRTPYRTYHSFETQVTSELVNKLETELSRAPSEIRARPFDPWNARRDFNALNSLVNACFTRHFDFAPLTDEENWDIFKWSIPLVKPPHLQFLQDGKKVVGFCLGLRDYSRLFRNDQDWKNAGRLLLNRSWKRARIVHVGILPEYQGKGLIKQVRHRVMLGFAREGMLQVENSYMDEGNQNSLGNVRSTGAQPLHEFRLHRVTG